MDSEHHRGLDVVKAEGWTVAWDLGGFQEHVWLDFVSKVAHRQGLQARTGQVFQGVESRVKKAQMRSCSKS